MRLESIDLFMERHKSLFVAALIFSVSFFLAELISYEWGIRIFATDDQDAALFYESFSHALFLYATILVLGLILTCLSRLFGLFKKQDAEILLEKTTHDLHQENDRLFEQLAGYHSVMQQSPSGIILTQKGKVQSCNAAMQPLITVKLKDTIGKDLESLFLNGSEITRIYDKCIAMLDKKPNWSIQTQLTRQDGEKSLYQILAFPLKVDKPQKGIVWLFQDFSAEAWNIELEKYYQTVFRALTLLHDFKDNDDEYELFHRILNEIIGIYGLKTAFFLTYHDNHLRVNFTVGDDQDFPGVKKDINLADKKMKNIAVVQAFEQKRAVGFSDIREIPYYRESFRRGNKRTVLSTYAFPVIIEGKVEGVISLYGHKIGFFSSNLTFRLQQLFGEICENIGMIRLRRRSQLAIHQYEDRLRLQIQELENNKQLLQRQAQILQEARASAEDANRSKSEFIASVSHELRTPLNAILGFSEAMTTEVFGPFPPQYKEYVKYVYSSGQYLLSLINDVLDLSSLEGEHLKFKENIIPLTPFVADMLSLIRHYPEGNDRQFFCRLKPEGVAIKIDERALKQIFLNILSNAVKFTESNGKISIESRLNKNGSIKISFQDNGIGIPADRIPQLFQPFAQVENVMTRRHKGTGLGLVLVKRLTELQDGTVQIKSDSGKGTTLTLTFPSSRVIQPSKEKKS